MLEQCVKDFSEELRRSLSLTRHRCENLRSNANFTQRQNGLDSQQALESAENIFRQVAIVKEEGSRMTHFIKAAPDTTALLSGLEAMLVESERKISEMEKIFGREESCAPGISLCEESPQHAADKLSAHLESDARVADVSAASRRPQTPPSTSQNDTIEDAGDELCRTPTMADFGISRVEVASLVRGRDDVGRSMNGRQGSVQSGPFLPDDRISSAVADSSQPARGMELLPTPEMTPSNGRAVKALDFDDVVEPGYV